jgi:hypothetical protein
MTTWDPAVDLLAIVDISAGTAGSKKATINETFTGWGFTTAGATVAKAADLAAIKTFLNYGTAAALDHGTAAGNLVRLDVTTGKLPAVDGSLLTNLPGGVLASQAEAEAGTENTKTMTPLRTAQAIAELAVGEVTLAGTETLTNKTLTAPVLVDPIIDVGTNAQGDIYFRSLSGDLAQVAIGSPGEVLRVNGAGTNPEWGTGGDLLSTNNLSDLTDPADARLHLGLILGTDVQAYDADLASWASVTRASGFDTFAATPSSANFFDLLTDKSGGGGGVVFENDAYLLDPHLNGVSIDLGGDAAGDLYFRTHPTGGTTRLPIGTTGQVLTVASGLPSWATPAASEPPLGNPGTNGYVLSSTTAGVRSWIALAGGGDLLSTNNLSDLANAGTARTNLGLGTAATLDHGTAAGNLVRLDPTTAKLPAVDGSLLTNLPAAPALSNFTESVNTSAPNATIPAVRLIATNAATNVDAVFSPKGTGSILAQIPDNGTGGGNKRGTNSVDFQQVRSSNTEVASGTESVVLGGYRNRASGTRSVVIGGISNVASGTEAVVLGGDSNTATNDNALSGGYSNDATGSASTALGYNNTASGTSSTALGQGNTASGSYSLVIGTSNNATHSNSFTTGSGAVSRMQCSTAQASGSLDGVEGSVQVGKYVLRLKTTNATTAKLTTTSGGGVDEVTLSNNSTYSFTGQISARSSTGDSATWRFSGTIERGANAAATALVGTPTITDTNSEAGSAAWTVAIVADTTGGALRFNVTGAAATNIRWVAQVDCAEVVY